MDWPTLALTMMLDAIPLVGVLVPGDAAVLFAVGTTGWAGDASALVAAVLGCLAGWSLSFAAGRRFGERIRHGRLGGWIGAERWAAAQRTLTEGGGRMVTVAPFLPALNALMPIVAGALGMPYRRFLARAAAGAALWVGLYVALGAAMQALGDLLPQGPVTTAGTVAVGIALSWLVLVGTRRRLDASAPEPHAVASRAVHRRAPSGRMGAPDRDGLIGSRAAVPAAWRSRIRRGAAWSRRASAATAVLFGADSGRADAAPQMGD